jgi:hypothetical protein
MNPYCFNYLMFALISFLLYRGSDMKKDAIHESISVSWEQVTIIGLIIAAATVSRAYGTLPSLKAGRAGYPGLTF